MKYKLIITLFMALTACSNKKYTLADLPYMPSLVTKDKSFYMNMKGESTPFVMNNELYLMISELGSWDSSNKGSIEIYKNNTLIEKVESSFSLSSAIVDNDTLYVYGTRNWDESENSMYMKSTKDFINWTDEIEVIKPTKNMIIYNNSIVKVNDRFYMTYETCEPNTRCFNIKFKVSNDLINWSDIGQNYDKNKYVACPTIKYDNGFFYLIYATQIDGLEPACETRISRSKNLIDWEKGQVIITPRDKFNVDSICDSDVDLTEYNNILEIYYIEGNQKNWQNLKRATFDGTFKQFVESIKFE